LESSLKSINLLSKYKFIEWGQTKASALHYFKSISTIPNSQTRGFTPKIKQQNWLQSFPLSKGALISGRKGFPIPNLIPNFYYFPKNTFMKANNFALPMETSKYRHN
jgi:hypothetical protein